MRSRMMTAGLLALVLAASCSDDDVVNVTLPDPGNGVEVTLRGILVGAIYSGDIVFTIGTATGAAIPVTGCLYLGSATCVTVTGNYNGNTHVLVVSTASPSLTFTGTYGNREVRGTFTGDDDGGFVIVNEDEVTAYCGTFDGDANGTWNFAVAGSSLEGVYDDGSGPEDLSGTVNGNSVSITFSGGTAGGTITGANASGTWTAAGNAGTWTGSSCRS